MRICLGSDEGSATTEADANVLAMSLRLTTPILAREIVQAFLDTDDVDPDEMGNIERVSRLESG